MVKVATPLSPSMLVRTKSPSSLLVEVRNLTTDLVIMGEFLQCEAAVLLSKAVVLASNMLMNR